MFSWTLDISQQSEILSQCDTSMSCELNVRGTLYFFKALSYPQLCYLLHLLGTTAYWSVPLYVYIRAPSHMIHEDVWKIRLVVY